MSAAVAALRSILPDGWTITRTTPSVVPEGWLSESATGVLVEGEKDHHTFRTWFLPRDWIGIRLHDPGRKRQRAWDAILAGADYTTITLSTERAFPGHLRRLGLDTTSVSSNGWDTTERAWRGRFDHAEAAAERLIAAHCRDQPALDEAAVSLLQLGVPAAGVFRRVALLGGPGAQTAAIRALRWFPGDATVAILFAVLRNPSTPPEPRSDAALVADYLRAPGLGPPLLDAFLLSPDDATRTRLADVLASLRYAPAGDALLRAMNAADSVHSKDAYASALASVGHQPAVPAIRAFVEEPDVRTLVGRYEEGLRTEARLALLRLTGDWGAPADGVRFLVDWPVQPDEGSLEVVKLYVENVSDVVRDGFDAAFGGSFVVDGVARERRWATFDGMTSLPPNEVWASTEDLAEWLAAPGEHSVQYVRGAGRSNAMRVVLG